MEASETGVSEDRIAALEKRLRDLESPVNRLVQDLLDLKAITMTMVKEAGEFRPVEPARGQFVQAREFTAPEDQAATPSFAAPSDNTTIIRPRATRQPDVPAAPAQPAMVSIMQADGTMKMEPRAGDSHQTDSSGGYGLNQKIRASQAKRPL